MIIDVHCHIGLSARRVDAEIPRFSFEQDGGAGTTGLDSYFSPRMLARPAWYFVKRWLGIDPRLPRGEALDAAIDQVNRRHWFEGVGFDRLVLLAFDEYHDDAGRAIGAAEKGQSRGTDLYASNSFVRSVCVRHSDRLLFGASIHPYRKAGDRDACALLEEAVAGGAVLVKWLPIHQNIRAEDPRTMAFLRKAAELRVPMLIHYGGEMSLSRQHMEFEHPGPMLHTLRRLRREHAMPTVIVAHMATPSFPWQNRNGFNIFIDALLGEFRDAPLYGDNSALAAFGRTRWLRMLSKRKDLQRKIVWGSDYPIPVMLAPFMLRIRRRVRRHIASLSSWIEQDLRLKQSLGFDDATFTQAAGLLRWPDRPAVAPGEGPNAS